MENTKNSKQNNILQLFGEGSIEGKKTWENPTQKKQTKSKKSKTIHLMSELLWHGVPWS